MEKQFEEKVTRDMEFARRLINTAQSELKDNRSLARRKVDELGSKVRRLEFDIFRQKENFEKVNAKELLELVELNYGEDGMKLLSEYSYRKDDVVIKLKVNSETPTLMMDKVNGGREYWTEVPTVEGMELYERIGEVLIKRLNREIRDYEKQLKRMREMLNDTVKHF